MNFFIWSTRADTRHALRRGEEHHHVDLFLRHGSVDGDVRLALGVGVDSLDLVTLDAVLSMILTPVRQAARERAGQVEDDADLDFLFLGLGATAIPSMAIAQTVRREGVQLCAPAWFSLAFLCIASYVLLPPITLVARPDVKRIARDDSAQAVSSGNPARQGWEANCASRNAVTKRGIAGLRSRASRTMWMADNSGSCWLARLATIRSRKASPGISTPQHPDDRNRGSGVDAVPVDVAVRFAGSKPGLFLEFAHDAAGYVEHLAVRSGVPDGNRCVRGSPCWPIAEHEGAVGAAQRAHAKTVEHIGVGKVSRQARKLAKSVSK